LWRRRERREEATLELPRAPFAADADADADAARVLLVLLAPAPSLSRFRT
jgi:hypothetical protein